MISPLWVGVVLILTGCPEQEDGGEGRCAAAAGGKGLMINGDNGSTLAAIRGSSVSHKAYSRITERDKEAGTARPQSRGCLVDK